MPDDPLSRRLTTIVALDVAGYSARTEADEARTTAEVAALRRVIEGIATAQGGRVFNTAGDGFMLEFGSSLAAVEAAFALADECEPKVPTCAARSGARWPNVSSHAAACSSTR
jgi:class 3 adenylate cyclase